MLQAHLNISSEVASKKEAAIEHLVGANLIGMFSSAIIIVLMNLTKKYFGLSADLDRVVLLMSLTVIPAFICSSFDSIFMAFEKMHLIFYYRVASKVISVGVSLIAIFLGYGLLQLTAILLVAGMISVILCAYLFHKHIATFRIRIDATITAHLLRKSPVFLMITLVSMLSARIDVIILAKMATLSQVAFYSAAYRLFELNMTVPQAYVKAAYPQISQIFRKDCFEFICFCKKIARRVSLFVIPVTVISVTAAHFIVTLIYGAKFAESGDIFVILMLGLIPWAWGRVFANALVASDNQRLDLFSGFIATAANIFLNLFLIPRYGMTGAAIANTASLSIFCASEYFFLRMVGLSSRTLLDLSWTLLPGILMCLMIYLAKLSSIVFLTETVACLAFFIYFMKRQGGIREALKKPYALMRQIR